MTVVHDIAEIIPGAGQQVAACAARVPAGATAVLPVVMVLDQSWSIAERGLTGELNAALQRWCSVMRRRPVLVSSALIAVVGMGREVATLDVSGDGSSPFVSVNDLRIPQVVPDGVTLLGESLTLALALIDDLVGELDAQERSRYVPHLVVVCDGQPTDAVGDPDDTLWRRPLPELHERTAAGRLICSALGFGTADPAVLRELAGESSVYLGSQVSLDDVLSIVSDSVEPGRADDYFARFRGQA